jgi:hypothetical protein
MLLESPIVTIFWICLFGIIVVIILDIEEYLLPHHAFNTSGLIPISLSDFDLHQITASISSINE